MFTYWRYCYFTPAALYRRLAELMPLGGEHAGERVAIRSILDQRMRRAAVAD